MSAPPVPAEARERVLPILREEHRARARESSGGFIDLLDEPIESTGVGQDLMHSRVVPLVYERWWRPALGRAFKGLTGPGMPEEIRIARLLMGLTQGDTVLDVACGPGNFSRAFARAVGPEGLVVGLDASESMLRRGAGELESSGERNLALVRGDVGRLPFEDDSFDGVCCFAALHLFAEPFDAIAEMTRVLTPGGRIALMTSVRRQLTHPLAKPLVERASGMRVFEPEEVVSALQMRGYEEIHQRVSGLVQFVGGRLGSR